MGWEMTLAVNRITPHLGERWCTHGLLRCYSYGTALCKIETGSPSSLGKLLEEAGVRCRSIRLSDGSMRCACMFWFDKEKWRRQKEGTSIRLSIAEVQSCGRISWAV